MSSIYVVVISNNRVDVVKFVVIITIPYMNNNVRIIPLFSQLSLLSVCIVFFILSFLILFSI